MCVEMSIYNPDSHRLGGHDVREMSDGSTYCATCRTGWNPNVVPFWRNAAIGAHEHFCSLCYGIGNGVKRGSARGWWRCVAKPCLHPESYECLHHRPGTKKR